MPTSRSKSARPGALPTEQVHPKAEDLDLCSVREIVHRLHAEDLVAVEAVGRVLPSIARAAEWVKEALAAGGRLFYVGAGTSGRLGVLDAVELPPTFGTSPDRAIGVMAGGEAAFARAVEGAEDDDAAGAKALEAHGLEARDVVVGITASSTTPFVRGALALAKKRGARTVLVCCNPDVPPGAADLLLLPATGPELVAGSTRLKAGTATKLVLNALSTAAMVALGRVYRGRMVTLRPTNAKLRARAEAMVSELAQVSPARAKKLLEDAGGEPRLALAMHFTGLPLEAARERVEKLGLRRLERREPT